MKSVMRFLRRSPREQVAFFRLILPLMIFVVVVLYQLFFVRRVHELGLTYHFAVEILFYGLMGPVVTWGVLTWIERQLVATERAEARAKEERRRRVRAVMEERARIAREIHEGVAQNLYFLGLRLRLCRNQIVKDSERVAGELEALQALLQEAIEDLRRLIWALRPVELEEFGPIEAVRRLAADLTAQMGLQVDVIVNGQERRFSPEIEGALYRIAQEALNNVAKHAEARSAAVRFTLSRDRVTVEIQDDGRGFDPDTAMRGAPGLGLRHLRERMEELGGRITVEAAPGAGTRLSAVLSLNSDVKGASLND
jgi:signal transduction histidine kinase